MPKSRQVGESRVEWGFQDGRPVRSGEQHGWCDDSCVWTRRRQCDTTMIEVDEDINNEGAANRCNCTCSVKKKKVAVLATWGSGVGLAIDQSAGRPVLWSV